MINKGTRFFGLKSFQYHKSWFQIDFCQKHFHFSFFLTTERSEVVLFLEYSSVAAYEVGCVREVASRKLPYFLEFWNETWREWSLAIDTGSLYTFVTFCHQGAKLFSGKGRKMRILSIFRVF